MLQLFLFELIEIINLITKTEESDDLNRYNDDKYQEC